ncbi:hypothetical protein CBEVV_013 [Choristoneura biennis entomopoxvirus 'L' virophage]|nr:hypothetical protein CBEVV_013 [Choristoneura biennis entomopoxvirus 'L' virophage]
MDLNSVYFRKNNKDYILSNKNNGNVKLYNSIKFKSFKNIIILLLYLLTMFMIIFYRYNDVVFYISIFINIILIILLIYSIIIMNKSVQTL